MSQVNEVLERRTNADVVFDYLYEQIGSLKLLPGSKISEAEIAAKLGVSRQPVRDAFSRLGNLDLLLIRPQRATEVKKFSMKSIELARFVRRSVELEVVRRAALEWDGSLAPQFDANLAAQEKALAEVNVDAFHELDYNFHKMFCVAAKTEMAFEVIAENKARVDRLCVLSLADGRGMSVLHEDHKVMMDQLKSGDVDGLTSTLRTHLNRLDDTIAEIHRNHLEYFN